MAVAARDVASERAKILHEIEGRALLAAFAAAERMCDQSGRWSRSSGAGRHGGERQAVE